ncbi:Os01g0362150 [Oryza sativa Japonica Group]|uniref:Os01g0362150 protein n=1 Tax=Oryza sativa subsp. japonica TaxID=39947 RepID=A0A0P0V2L5_ORYSJ|nr:Os01g0362150 [Oryza sativa Japonica Group]
MNVGGVSFLRAQRGGARYLCSWSASPTAAAAAAWHRHGGGFWLHKARGQHLLTNPRVLDAIVAHAALRSARSTPSQPSPPASASRTSSRSPPTRSTECLKEK